MDEKTSTISVTDLIKKLTRPVDSVQTVTGSWGFFNEVDNKVENPKWYPSGPGKFIEYSDSHQPREIQFDARGIITTSNPFMISIHNNDDYKTATVIGYEVAGSQGENTQISIDDLIDLKSTIKIDGISAIGVDVVNASVVNVHIQTDGKRYVYTSTITTTGTTVSVVESDDTLFTHGNRSYIYHKDEPSITDLREEIAILSNIKGEFMDMCVDSGTYVSVEDCDSHDGTCVRKLIVVNSSGVISKELHENHITPGDHHTDTITSVKMGPDGAWPFTIQAGDSVFEWRQDGTVVRKLTGVKDILGWGSNGSSARAIIYRLKSSPETIRFEPSLVPSTSSGSVPPESKLSDNGTFLRTYSGNRTITVAHQSQEDVLGITKWATVSSYEVTFSPNRQYVMMKDSAGRPTVRRFVLYSKRLFDGLTSDSDIERYLEYFQMICESEYGKGDPFCRCANYSGELTKEYGLDDDTYLSKRLRQSVQCLDGDCIYRKNLKNNIVSVYKLNATDCNMDLTVCSSDFNSKDISASSQVNVVNQCGVGTDQATPDFNNNSSSVSGLRAPSIVTCVVVSLLLLFLVGAYIHYRSGRGKGKK
jgi:hypothetical protein